MGLFFFFFFCICSDLTQGHLSVFANYCCFYHAIQARQCRVGWRLSLALAWTQLRNKELRFCLSFKGRSNQSKATYFFCCISSDLIQGHLRVVVYYHDLSCQTGVAILYGMGSFTCPWMDTRYKEPRFYISFEDEAIRVKQLPQSCKQAWKRRESNPLDLESKPLTNRQCCQLLLSL